MVRMGRMTALKQQASTASWQETLSGDLSRKTIASDSGSGGKGHIALSVRECIAHALQVVIDADPEATMLSVDEIMRTIPFRVCRRYGAQTNGRERCSHAVRESVLWFPLHLSLAKTTRGC